MGAGAFDAPAAAAGAAVSHFPAGGEWGFVWMARVVRHATEHGARHATEHGARLPAPRRSASGSGGWQCMLQGSSCRCWSINLATGGRAGEEPGGGPACRGRGAGDRRSGSSRAGGRAGSRRLRRRAMSLGLPERVAAWALATRLFLGQGARGSRQARSMGRAAPISQGARSRTPSPQQISLIHCRHLRDELDVMCALPQPLAHSTAPILDMMRCQKDIGLRQM